MIDSLRKQAKKSQKIAESEQEHIYDCVKGKVNVMDGCNCDACQLCFEISADTKGDEPSFLRDKIIFHHAFTAGWNEREKAWAAELDLLKAKIKDEKHNLVGGKNDKIIHLWASEIDEVFKEAKSDGFNRD